VSDEVTLRRDVVAVGRRLDAKGFIAGAEGNFSVRRGEPLFVTPVGACRGFLNPEDTAGAGLEAPRVPAGYPPPPETFRPG
jgi:ribulose-5-phosphate 4-epimerase/fuculose-1-phosphate aldolase